MILLTTIFDPYNLCTVPQKLMQINACVSTAPAQVRSVRSSNRLKIIIKENVFIEK